MERCFCDREIICTKTHGIYYFCDSSLCARELAKNQTNVNLIYLDPPFCTGGDFPQNGDMAYRDRQGREDFIAFMRDILTYSHEILSPDGSLYLHIDYRMSAYMRILLDEVFGEGNFRNEIIWSYNSGGRAKRHFSRKHDTIYFYSKADGYFFDISAVGVKRGAGRRNNMKRDVDGDGRTYYSIRSNGREYRYYEDALIYPTDVWTDISHLHQRDGERTGYPTQKPLSLLHRIISASSPAGGCVCDFFSGSGTTSHAACNLGREWIAADNSPLALISLKKRLPGGDCETVIHHRTVTDEVPVSISLYGNTCEVTGSDAGFVYLSAGYIKDGAFYTLCSTADRRAELPDCDNAAMCVADGKGRIGFYKVR